MKVSATPFMQQREGNSDQSQPAGLACHEAGKGFAVVAGEVKALAAQTSKATAEIATQIETMRGSTGEAVSAMTEIGSIIGRMGDVTGAISAAVEQQTLTTRGIGASVQWESGNGAHRGGNGSGGPGGGGCR